MPARHQAAWRRLAGSSCSSAGLFGPGRPVPWACAATLPRPPPRPRRSPLPSCACASARWRAACGGSRSGRRTHWRRRREQQRLLLLLLLLRSSGSSSNAKRRAAARSCHPTIETQQRLTAIQSCDLHSFVSQSIRQIAYHDSRPDLNELVQRCIGSDVAPRARWAAAAAARAAYHGVPRLRAACCFHRGRQRRSKKQVQGCQGQQKAGGRRQGERHVWVSSWHGVRQRRRQPSVHSWLLLSLFAVQPNWVGPSGWALS